MMKGSSTLYYSSVCEIKRIPQISIKVSKISTYIDLIDDAVKYCDRVTGNCIDCIHDTG